MQSTVRLTAVLTYYVASWMSKTSTKLTDFFKLIFQHKTHHKVDWIYTSQT